jgi:hypothetical protein
MAVTTLWIIATSVIAARQALDYRGTARAVIVCATAWLISIGWIALLQMLFSSTVS